VCSVLVGGTGNVQSIEHLEDILLPESFLLVMLEEEDVTTLGQQPHHW